MKCRTVRRFSTALIIAALMALAAACHPNSECEVRGTTAQGISRAFCHTVGFLTDFIDGDGTP